MRKKQPDTLVMINPVCPLVEPEDVQKALAQYRRSDCDTLITCNQTQMQTFCGTHAVNIDVEGPLAPTQENPPVMILNWAVTVWDTPSFLYHYMENKAAYIGRSRLLLPIDPWKSIKISYEEDFQMAELLIRAKSLEGQSSSRVYWEPGQPI